MRAQAEAEAQAADTITPAQVQARVTAAYAASLLASWEELDREARERAR
jgi:hypothetical protein